jgi:hypothetical protein
MFILIIPCVHERGWSEKKKEKGKKKSGKFPAFYQKILVQQV